MIKKYAIIVAGGTGTRMSGEVPKQFMLLSGKPVILHSIEAFYSYDPLLKLILVIHPEYFSYWEQLCGEFGISIPFQLAPGDTTRFGSVKNGLELTDDEGFVAIHDAARPLVDADFIGKLFLEAEKFGSAVPGITLNDTIRQLDGDTSRQLDRSLLRAVQTPQVFRVNELKRAYAQPFQPIFTDDASVMQSAGFPLHIVEGSRDNMKITHPTDIPLAEILLHTRSRQGK